MCRLAIFFQVGSCEACFLNYLMDTTMLNMLWRRSQCGDLVVCLLVVCCVFASCLLLVYSLLVFSFCLCVACLMLVCCVILFVCYKPETLRFFFIFTSLCWRQTSLRSSRRKLKSADCKSLGNACNNIWSRCRAEAAAFRGLCTRCFFLCRNNRILLYKFCSIVVFLFRVVRIFFYTRAFSHELPARVWRVHVFTYFDCSCDGPPEYG